MPRIVILALLLLTFGCSRPNSVRGTVTYDGVKLPNGYISFFPTGNEGSSTGAEIINGAYLVEEITPGSMRVLVTTRPVILASKVSPGENPTLRVYKVEAVPADAPGNNQVVEVQPGEQTIDIALRRRK